MLKSLAPGMGSGVQAWLQHPESTIFALPVAVTTITLTEGTIAFPATPFPSNDPNTLDDYEEGVFSPGLSFGGVSVGMAYTGRMGRYQKIGKFIHIIINIQLSNKGTSQGVARVTGLPFPAANIAQQLLSYYGTPEMQISGASVPNGGSIINFLPLNEVTHSEFTNTTNVLISGMYEAPA